MKKWSAENFSPRYICATDTAVVNGPIYVYQMPLLYRLDTKEFERPRLIMEYGLRLISPLP